MNELTVRDTLKRVQELIAKETGGPLRGDAEKRLENLLRNAADQPDGVSRGPGFLSREVTILLADLRGFTSISAAYPAGTVLELLNRCLARMSEIIFRHQGSIDKFMGDSIMVLFGALASHEDDVRRALACAVEMQLAMDELNEQHRATGMPDLYLGIGINTGVVMAGLIGSDLYSEFTVIGDNVNLASRIEAFSLRGQVLISPSTFERCRDFVTTGDPMEVHVKGKSEPVSLREVLGIPSLGRAVPRKEVRRSPRVDVKMPFTYQVIENDVVIPELYGGRVLDIAYHGVLAELDWHLPTYSEIKLDLDLPLVGHKATDIYAKIVKTKGGMGGVYLSGIEFTSVSAQSNMNIQLFVQLLIQGSENK
ncbi:MAG TPA: adenylate/guanylate cyclase domain-containing protein [Burkholderiales bacterium]|nr:adenylate/guanylate cyclase domain-containing protein [Burkholderiales bacterium]